MYSFPRYSALFAVLALYKMDHATLSVGDEERSAEPPTTVTATPNLSSEQLASLAALVAGLLASRTEGRMFPQLPTSPVQPPGPAVSATPTACSTEATMSASLLAPSFGSTQSFYSPATVTSAGLVLSQTAWFEPPVASANHPYPSCSWQRQDYGQTSTMPPSSSLTGLQPLWNANNTSAPSAPFSAVHQPPPPPPPTSPLGGLVPCPTSRHPSCHTCLGPRRRADR